MRNLKKVLSLTLALVMMLGMMTFAGAAETAKITSKDLTDMNDVVNKEAVTLLVDLGIVNGIKQADGTYKYAPKDTINRASYAKMIYAVMMASNNADVYKGVNTGLKDVAGHWAEGFIGYCVTTKLAVGNGNGAYMPDTNITTVAASKMLLVALGYDAKASGYEGDELWSISIMRDAQKAGLLNNVDQKASENLTRDNAAQLIYNALFARTVVPTFQYDMGIKHLTKYDPNATTLGQEVFGLAKVEATVGAIDGATVNLTSANAADHNKDELDKSLTDAKSSKSGFKFTPEMVGNNVVFYAKCKVATDATGKVILTYKELISTSVFAGATTVLATVNTGIADFDKAAKKGDDKFVAEVEQDSTGANYTATYYVNGIAGTSVTQTVGKFACATFTAAIKRVGAIVEFIDTNGNGKAEIVKVTDKTVATLTADPSTKVVVDDTQVKVPGVINAFSTADTSKTVVGYEGLKKGDVVLYVKIGTTTFIEKAASVEGVVTAKNSDKKIKVDGTYYGSSGLKNASNNWADDYKNTYKFYLDNAKAIVKAEKVTEETVSAYVVVLENSWVAGSGEIGASKFAQARVLHTDGTSEIVKVGKVGDKTIVAPSTTGSSTAKENVEVNYCLNYTGTADNFAITDGKIYTYTVDSKGVYALSAVKSTNKTNVTIKAGQAALTTGSSPIKIETIANANTIFLVKTGTSSDPVYTAYKGISNVPTMNGTATIEFVDKDSVAACVYVSVTGTIAGTVGEYIYVPSDTTSVAYTEVPNKDGTIAYKETTAIVDGVVTTIKVAIGVTLGGSGSAETDIKANTLYTIATKDVDGVIGTVAPATMVAGFISSNGTLITAPTADTKASYIMDADTQIFYLAKDGTVSQLDMNSLTSDATDEIIVAKKDSNNLAQIVYVKQVIAATSALTSVTYSLDGVAATVAAAAFDTSPLTEAVTGAAAAKITIDEVKLPADGSTYVISATTGAVPSTGLATFTITVTAENGTNSSVYTLTFAATGK